MPAKNPVIQVVLPREVYAAIKRLAALRSVSMSSVIREFLIETLPVLERISNLLDLAARADKTALKAWANDLDAAQGEMERSALGAMAGMDTLQTRLELSQPGRPPAGAERARKRGAAAPRSRQGKRQGKRRG